MFPEAQPDDELTAALVAVQSYLDAERAAPAQPIAAPPSGWHASAKLSVQHLRPVKTRVAPRWNTIERLRRGTSGGYGVTGL